MGFGKWDIHMGKAAGNDYQKKKWSKNKAKSLAADPFDITMVTRK